jgi:hypothetical protein
MEWKPIETAPRDCQILLCKIYNDGDASISAGEWVDEIGGFDMMGYTWHMFPTHWMPLPEPPNGTESKS